MKWTPLDWNYWVQVYGASNGKKYGWCFKCGLKLEYIDVGPHRMFHALKEAS